MSPTNDDFSSEFGNVVSRIHSAKVHTTHVRLTTDQYNTMKEHIAALEAQVQSAREQGFIIDEPAQPDSHPA